MSDLQERLLHVEKDIQGLYSRANEQEKINNQLEKTANSLLQLFENIKDEMISFKLTLNGWVNRLYGAGVFVISIMWILGYLIVRIISDNDNMNHEQNIMFKEQNSVLIEYAKEHVKTDMRINELNNKVDQLLRSK